MEVNVAKLKGKIVERGKTQERLAAELSMDKSTFSRKISGGALGFSIEEMHGIVERLELSGNEAKEIFLFENSQ